MEQGTPLQGRQRPRGRAGAGLFESACRRFLQISIGYRACKRKRQIEVTARNRLDLGQLSRKVFPGGTCDETRCSHLPVCFALPAPLFLIFPFGVCSACGLLWAMLSPGLLWGNGGGERGWHRGGKRPAHASRNGLCRCNTHACQRPASHGSGATARLLLLRGLTEPVCPLAGGCWGPRFEGATASGGNTAPASPSLSVLPLFGNSVGAERSVRPPATYSYLEAHLRKNPQIA